MPRCSCAGSTCGCKVEALGGSGVYVEGNGSASNPYRVSTEVNAVDSSVLIFSDSDTVTFEVAGSGTKADPLVVEATVAVGVVTRLPSYTTGARPAAATAGQGGAIWNTTTNQINVSDGATWRKADGTAA
jgi:hypothetical protein